MKKSKAKSILACAVLASVMAIGNVAMAYNNPTTQISSTGIYYDGDTSHLIIRWGGNTQATGFCATAWGYSTQATANYATAWGYQSAAKANGATTWGGYYSSSSDCPKGGTAYGKASTAWGIGTTAGKDGDSSAGKAATAWGNNSTASGNYSTAFGFGTTASDSQATAFGLNTTASGQHATAWGYKTTASAYAATAYGINATASGKGSTAWGGCLDGSYNSIIGGTAVGDASTAWGVKTIANGLASTTFGENSKAGGENSLAALGGTTGTWTAEPQYNSSDYKWTSTGTLSTTTGQTGKNAVAIGEGAHAKYDNSVAIGQYAVTTLGSISADETNKIKFNEFAVGGGKSGDYTYLSRITGVADGVNAHDAVNKGQLDAAVAAGGSKVELKSGETNLTLADGTGADAGKKILSLKDTLSLTSVTTTGNVSVGGTLSVTGNVTMSGTLGVTGALNGSTATFSGAVTAGSFKIDDNNLWNTSGLKAGTVTANTFKVGTATYIDSNGLNANSKKIINVADGTVSSISTDAVNGKLLYNATTLTTAGKNYDANATVVTAVGKIDTALGKYNGTDVKGTYAKNGNVAADVKALDTQVKKNADAIGDANSGLTKDVTAIKAYVTDSGLDANNKKITKVLAGTEATDAANMSQVVTQVGDNLTLDNATGTGAVGKKITLNDNILLTNAGSFGIKDASSGQVVTIDKTGIVAPMYKIAENNVWDATNGLIATTGKFGGVVEISANGIAMGSQKITGLANGTEATDAVNKGQLDAAVAGLSDVMSTTEGDSKKLVADGVVAPSTTDKSGHIVTGKTVYDAMYSAVGNAFTGATDSKGLKYDADNSKLVANVPLNVTDATNNANLSATGLDVNGKVKVGTGLDDPMTTDTTETDFAGISLKKDGDFYGKWGFATNGGLGLSMHSKDGDSGYREVSLTSYRLEFSKGGSTIKTRYSWDGIDFRDNNNQPVGPTITSTRIDARNTTIANVSNPVDNLDAANKQYVDTAVTTVSGNVSALTDRVSANEGNIVNLQSDMTQAKTDISALQTTVGDASSGLVKDVADLQTAVGGTTSGLVKDVADNAADIATNASDIDKIEATIGTYTTTAVAGTHFGGGTGKIADDVNKIDIILGDHTQNIADIYSKIGGGTSGASNVYIGNQAEATNTSVAIGSGAKATGANTVSIGADNVVSGNKSTAVGYKNTVSGANSGAFGDPNNVSGDGSYAFGNDNTISGNNSFVMGNNVTVTSENAVVLGNGSADGGENTVSVGAKDAERKIVNVADGNVAEDSTDAVNGGQLWNVEQKIDENIQNEINTINNHIDRMGTRINKVGAGAAALAAMHPVYDEDSKLTFSAGLGSYRNEQAAAVGMFFRFSPRVMMNAGATVGNDNNMYNVGLNFALDRHVRGGLPSKAVMARQLNSLTLENSALKEKLATMDAKMVQQGEQIAQLMAMIEELKNK